MGLIEQAKEDVKRITGNSDEWGVPISLEAPGGETATVIGLHKKHHTGFDTEGRPARVKDATVSLSEENLNDASYPVRNAAGEVNLRGHKVSVKDSTGLNKQYVIREWYPDETIGLIVCILGDFE